MRVPWKTRSDMLAGYSLMPRWMWVITLLPSAIALGQFPAIAAAASPIPPALLTENPPLIAQSTRVSDLRDISPTDWAFQTVQMAEP